MTIFIQQETDDEAELWVGEIQSSVEAANKDSEIGIRSKD
jgi:hypothetical protein